MLVGLPVGVLYLGMDLDITRRGSRGGIWGFIPPQFFASQNDLKCLS